VELRDHENLVAYGDDGGGLAQFTEKSLMQLEYLNRRGHLEPNWEKPEDVTRFYNGQGRPEASDGYDLTEVAVPESVRETMDAGVKDALVGILHKHGATQRQVPGMMQDYMEIFAASKQAEKEHTDALRVSAEASLQKSWGNAYEPNVDLAQRAMRKACGSDQIPEEVLTKKFEDGSTVGSSPVMLEMWKNIGVIMHEGSLLGPKNGGIRPMDPETAQTELDKFMYENRGRDSALYDKMNPMHESVLAKKSALYAAINPER